MFGNIAVPRSFRHPFENTPPWKRYQEIDGKAQIYGRIFHSFLRSGSHEHYILRMTFITCFSGISIAYWTICIFSWHVKYEWEWKPSAIPSQNQLNAGKIIDAPFCQRVIALHGTKYGSASNVFIKLLHELFSCFETLKFLHVSVEFSMNIYSFSFVLLRFSCAMKYIKEAEFFFSQMYRKRYEMIWIFSPI